jgi:hypothetical protein
MESFSISLSAVTGAEVFLKAISIPVTWPIRFRFHHRQLDLYPLGKDYHAPWAKMCRSITTPAQECGQRPTSRRTRLPYSGRPSPDVPTLHEQSARWPLARPSRPCRRRRPGGGEQRFGVGPARNPRCRRGCEELLQRRPHLARVAEPLCQAYRLIAKVSSAAAPLSGRRWRQAWPMPCTFPVSCSSLSPVNAPFSVEKSRLAARRRRTVGRFSGRRAARCGLGRQPFPQQRSGNDFAERI